MNRAFKKLVYLLILPTLQVPVIADPVQVTCAEESPVVGAKLPNKSGQNMMIGRTPISKAYVYGRSEHVLKVVSDLIKDDSFFTDVTCNFLLLRADEVLSGVEKVPVPEKYQNLTCNQLIWEIPIGSEFLALYAELKKRPAQPKQAAINSVPPPVIPPMMETASGGDSRDFSLGDTPQYLEEACGISGGLCAGADGTVTYSIGCNGQEVSITNNGDVSVTLKSKSGATVTLPLIAK